MDNDRDGLPPESAQERAPSGYMSNVPYEPPSRLPHSGPGIASFVVSLVMFVLFVILIVSAVSVSIGLLNENGTVDPDELQSQPAIVFLGLGMMGAGVGNIVGLVLGIIGLVQKERKKIFAILGTVFNGGIVFLFLFLFLIGILGAFAR